MNAEYPKAEFVIAQSLMRYHYCTDPVHGRSNAATYALKDVLITEGIIEDERKDIPRLWMIEDMRIGLGTWGIRAHQIPDTFRLTRIVAERYHVEPMIVPTEFSIFRGDFKPFGTDSSFFSQLPPYILFNLPMPGMG